MKNYKAVNVYISHMDKVLPQHSCRRFPSGFNEKREGNKVVQLATRSNIRSFEIGLHQTISFSKSADFLMKGTFFRYLLQANP